MPGRSSGERFVIAQFSDIHCGDPRFDEHMLERVIREVNEARPDVVVIPGDLTVNGYRDEFELAHLHIERIELKTYGVCKVTGKAISRERLEAVPHTEISIEAKLQQNKR